MSAPITPTEAQKELGTKVRYALPGIGDQLIAESEARTLAEIRDDFAKLTITSAQLADSNVSLRQERDQLRAERNQLRDHLIYADQILDDIDTCSDAHKPMYSSYSQNVFKLCIKGRDARRAAIDAAMTKVTYEKH